MQTEKQINFKKEEVSKESNYLFFKHLFLFIKPTFNFFIKKGMKKDIIKKANILLYKKDFLSYQELINNGYIPTKKQENIFTKSILFLFHHNLSFLHKLLEKDLMLNDNTCCEIYFEYNFHKNFNDIYLNMQKNFLNIEDKDINLTLKENKMYYPIFINRMKKFIDNDNNLSLLKNEWIKRISENFDKEECSLWITETCTVKTYSLLHSYILQNSSFEEKTNISFLLYKIKYHFLEYKNSTSNLDELINKLDTYMNELNVQKEHLISPEFKKILDKTKIVYTENKINNLTKIITNDTSSNGISLLPKESQIIIDEIQQLYKNLMIDDSVINLEVKMNIDRFVFQRLPEIINKYNSIDVKLKETMVDKNGRKPSEILLDSILNIKEYLEKEYIDINQKKIDNLSVTESYTRNYLK